MSAHLHIVRFPASYRVRKNPELPESWENNGANNSLDSFVLYAADGKVLLTCRAQTVVNIPGGRAGDTVAPGTFRVKLWVAPRGFWCEPHGIVGAKDIEGQDITEDSVQSLPGKDGAPVDFSRWLIHDWQKQKPQPKGTLTRLAWSLGCFVVPVGCLAEMNRILKKEGYVPGDEIPCTLEEA